MAAESLRNLDTTLPPFCLGSAHKSASPNLVADPRLTLMPATTLEPFPGELDKFQFMFILDLRAIVTLPKAVISIPYSKVK
jgi:hypothetical protein